ncbi:unnamed protein product [Schistocephalus solidus]|uniref:UPF0506 domain-containing protein n=1 Tax=Schistocephalus solidus TaxID=70667 RepID=A0A3P7BYT8_SCHSO|nr:unnamed protein product [Schistocephalus solidus]
MYFNSQSRGPFSVLGCTYLKISQDNHFQPISTVTNNTSVNFFFPGQDACKSEGEFCSKTVFHRCCGQLICDLDWVGSGKCVKCLDKANFCLKNSECCSKSCSKLAKPRENSAVRQFFIDVVANLSVIWNGLAVENALNVSRKETFASTTASAAASGVHGYPASRTHEVTIPVITSSYPFILLI